MSTGENGRRPLIGTDMGVNNFHSLQWKWERYSFSRKLSISSRGLMKRKQIFSGSRSPLCEFQLDFLATPQNASVCCKFSSINKYDNSRDAGLPLPTQLLWLQTSSKAGNFMGHTVNCLKHFLKHQIDSLQALKRSVDMLIPRRWCFQGWKLDYHAKQTLLTVFRLPNLRHFTCLANLCSVQQHIEIEYELTLW